MDIIKISRNTTNSPISCNSTQTVAFSHYNNISAQLPINAESGDIVSNDIKEQAKQCLTNIKNIVESINHTMDDLVKATIFLKNISDMEAVNEVYKTFFNKEFPTQTVVEVDTLPKDGALVQIEALISNGEGTTPQDPVDLVKVSRNTVNAPVSKFSSQTVAFSHYNNLSAQLPLDPKTLKIVSGGIKEQTKQCLLNIKAILESIGHNMNDVVKTTIYLKNLSDIKVVNEICAEFYPDYAPVRSIVNASALPMEALIQIDTSVSHGDGTPPQLPEDAKLIIMEANNTKDAPAASYSHTVAFSHYNHISGQLPLDPRTNKIVDGGIEAQTKQCLTNIKAIIESVDHVIDDTVKLNIQVKNISDADIVNSVCSSFFTKDLPARTLIGVSDISMEALVQIDAVVSNCEGTPPQD